METVANAKPTYAVMVTESIRSLKDRTGSSVPAIKKQLGTQFQIDATKINQKALTNAIKKGVEAGDLVQIKASYKLSKKPPAPKKALTEKAAKPAPAKKKKAAKPKTTTVATTTKPATKAKPASKSTVTKVCVRSIFLESISTPAVPLLLRVACFCFPFF